MSILLRRTDGEEAEGVGREHRTAFNSGKPHDSAMAAHCLITGHNIQRISAKLFHNTTQGHLLNKLEETETIATKSRDDTRLLNDLDATWMLWMLLGCFIRLAIHKILLFTKTASINHF